VTINGHTQIPRSEGGSIREAHFQRAKRAIAGIIEKIDDLYMEARIACRIGGPANFGAAIQKKKARAQGFNASGSEK
jgi:hypothetical protein